MLACFSGESGAAPGMARQGPYGSTWTCSAVGKAKLKIDVPSWGLQTVAYSGAACVKKTKGKTPHVQGLVVQAVHGGQKGSKADAMANSGHAIPAGQGCLSWQQQVQLGYSWFTCFQQPHTGRAQSVHTIVQAAARLAAYASRNARALQQAMKMAPGRALNLAQD